MTQHFDPIAALGFASAITVIQFRTALNINPVNRKCIFYEHKPLFQKRKISRQYGVLNCRF